MIFTNDYKKNNITCALDIGTSKISCVISKNNNGQRVILGFSVCENLGIEKNDICDVGLLRESIFKAIKNAEKNAGIKVKNVYIAISFGRVKSYTLKCISPIAYGQKISHRHLKRNFKSLNLNKFKDKNENIIHIFPVQYIIDGRNIGSSPIGVVGQDLEIIYNAITLDKTILENILNIVKSCYINVEGITVPAYSCGLAFLNNKNNSHGHSIVLDIGSTNTSVGVFKEQNLISTFSFGFGGELITMDLAQTFNISMQEAERIKIYHGTVSYDISDDIENITVNIANDTNEIDTKAISQSQITKTIRVRVEDSLKRIKMLLDHNGLLKSANRVILTGGCSKLRNINDLAYTILEKPIVVSFKSFYYAIPDELKDPNFSSVLGVPLYKEKDFYSLEKIEKEQNNFLERLKNKILEYV